MGHSRATPTPQQSSDSQDIYNPQAFPDNSWLSGIFGAMDTGGQYGTAGAMGREGAVQSQLRAAYNLGNQAPQGNYNGSVFRNVGSGWVDGIYDSTRSANGSGMRYNAGGQQLNYNSPTFAESVGEMGAYRSNTNPTGMANRTMVEANYRANVDPVTGRGGVADVTTLANQRGMTNALTSHKGNSGGHWSYRLMGENPYSMPQQVGKGATDAGASGMRVPSATGGNQIDIVPRNTNASQITPLEMTPFDADGNPMASSRNVSSIKPMVADTSPDSPGQIKSGPGQNGRSSSVRYGALGGGLMSLGTDLYRMANGEDVSLGQVALDTGVGTAMGAGGALATDALIASGRGALGAGGIVGGVIEGGMSAYNNINAYRNGDISGSQAAANTIVDTGVGVGAGMAGAALGAAIGSIIPGAGTAVGAGLGFLGGMAGSYIAHALADKTGAANWAKEKLGAGIGWAADGISSVGSSIGSGLSSAAEWAGNGISNIGSGISNAASSAWDAVTSW